MHIELRRFPGEDDMSKVGSAVWLAFTFGLLALAQGNRSTVATTQMVVTVGHYYGHEPPLLTRDDLIITQQVDPLPVTKLTPLRGERASLELFLLVDNCSNCEPGSKFEELRRFISSQPATTSVGVAYIQDGLLKIAQNPTLDRERSISALSAPTGSKPWNPFGALASLIRDWPKSSARHAVLMISNGIDPAATDEMRNPAAEAAIDSAQKAGVTVYAIYHPSADYVTSDFSKIYSGQVQLAHLANETGGEAYFLGFGPLPSLAPFLSDIADHLANQYLVEFLVTPCQPPGDLQPLTVKTTIKDLELMAPDKAWVPGRTFDPPDPKDKRKKRP
jgi:hypothetical protein